MVTTAVQLAFINTTGASLWAAAWLHIPALCHVAERNRPKQKWKWLEIQFLCFLSGIIVGDYLESATKDQISDKNGVAPVTGKGELTPNVAYLRSTGRLAVPRQAPTCSIQVFGDDNDTENDSKMRGMTLVRMPTNQLPFSAALY